MRLDLGNGEVELDVNFWTLVIYEQQFGGDLIGDLFGKVTAEEDENGVLSIDYTKYNWVAATRAMWSACFCADRTTPPYEDWCRTMSDVNMWPLINEFKSEILARLFRTGAADSE